MKRILKFVQLIALLIIVIEIFQFYLTNNSELFGSSLNVFTNKSQDALKNYTKKNEFLETQVDKYSAISKRVIVPVHQTVLSNDIIRYSIPITIGGTKLEGMLDTGSPGIRILPVVTKNSDLKLTNRITTEHYGSGVALKGVIAQAEVVIGNIESKNLINIAAVETVMCDSQHPKCAASRISQQNYRIGGGSTGKGFKAIIGVNLAANGRVNNPLPRLGVTKWIIILPKPGEKNPGNLILNPDKADLTGYTLFQLDTTSNPRDGISACITNLRTNKQVCGPAILDTGAPGVHVVTNEIKKKKLRFKVGDEGQIKFSNQTGDLPPMKFKESPKGAAHIKVSLPKKHQPDNAIYAGILPFFTYSVFYDSEHDIIGLKLRKSEYK